MNDLLRYLARSGEISWLSYYFARFIAEQTQTGIDELPALSAALVSGASQAGDVCIDIAELTGRRLFHTQQNGATEIPIGPDCESWCNVLRACNCVGEAHETAPLTLEGTRLYLHRYWRYEDFVADRILALLNSAPEDVIPDLGSNADSAGAHETDIDADQQKAVVCAAARHFSIISGGPGSGKTSTVVRILSLLLKLDPACRIALAAPTGRAAARMVAAIRERLGEQEVFTDSIPSEACTIHRLLGYRGRDFSYGEHRRLAYDCVIVDEASMIDLKMMYHLLSALPDHARLILLGDRDQLASVAAGNVLGDITGHGHDLNHDHENPGLAESITLLRRNYRFDRDSAIGELATLVNQGRRELAEALLLKRERGLEWYAGQSDQVHEQLLERVYQAYQPIFDSDSPDSALTAFEAARVLCATNRGPLGVDSLNGLISQALLKRNNLPGGDLYHGLPVMITRNHHRLGLYNGDTGVLWRFESGLRACFRDGEAGLRDFSINRLPNYRPAWASTVHKSQGSEFDEVLLLLPADPESETLSRELLYTAITRARRRFVLQAPPEVVGSAIDRLTHRHSGLGSKLGWHARCIR